MANWSNPLLTSTYVNFVTEVKDRDVDLALQFDGTTSSNIPTGAIRWNSGVNRWQKWNGSVWGELTGTYALTGLSTTGNATIAGTITTGSVGTNGSITFLRTSDGATINSIAFDSASEEMRLNNAAANGKIAFLTSTTERARIDSSGRLLVGTNTARDIYYNATATAKLQVEGTDGNSSSISLVRNSADAGSGALILGKTRGNSVGATTAVQSGDAAGEISFQGSDGTEFVSVAVISGEVDGTPGANDMPGRLVLRTTADGASSPTERMRIDSSGRVGIGTASPVCPLHVSTNLSTTTTLQTSATDIYLRFVNSVNSGGYVGYNGSALTLWTEDVERVRVDSAGVLKFNSGFGSVGNAYGCRAWANINAGATPVIRASGNVSSVTDFGAGVGAFTVSFTAAMPDANFAAVVSAGGGNVEAGDAVVGWAGEFATGYVRIGIKDSTSNANVDTEHCMVAIFR
jgi:hypothetical protein